MKIDRREMLAGLAGCSLALAGQEPERVSIDPSLYIPKAQLVEDRTLLHEFMTEHPFVEFITAIPTLRITHLPVILDRTMGRFGHVLGHMSRQNPQAQALDGGHQAVAVFRGPQGYISPTWFAKKDAVPTWNFAVVHASGRPKATTDKTKLRHMLDRLVDFFERKQGSSYDLSSLSEGYVSSLMEGIVGFEMDIEALEGKFKLGQNWNPTEKQAALEHLRLAPAQEPSLYEFSAKFFTSWVQK